jgi:polyhydroxyalkanoate synthesis regulator phasin
MPAPKSPASGSRAPSRAKATANTANAKATANTKATASAPAGDSLAAITEQLVNRVIKPLGLVLLTRERIQETLDEAAQRGRVTRTDANELVAELVRRGRQQTDDVFADFELLLERGRDQLVRGADRARRTVGAGAGPALPIAGYDELTAAQVGKRLNGLTAAELRRVRDYERRHANRKSVLTAVEKSLA